jgi:hypothetical protein
MLVNGFASSTVEIGRNSLFMITIAATQNVVSGVIGKCNKSLAEVTNSVYMYVKKMLFRDMEERGMSDIGKEKEDRGEERGAERSLGIIVNSGDKGIKSIIKDGEKAAGLKMAAAPDIMEERRYAYEGAGSDIVLIIFIMFIAGIRRRKGRIGIESEEKCKRKIRISA